MKNLYFLVKVQAADSTTPAALRDEILSNLESVVNDEGREIEGNIIVQPLPAFEPDLITLQHSTSDTTPAIECAAALNNITIDIAKALDIEIPEPDEDGETDLSRFTETKPKRAHYTAKGREQEA